MGIERFFSLKILSHELGEKKHDISNRSACEKRYKSLMPLNLKDDVRAFLFSVVVQKTIVTNLLETFTQTQSGRIHQNPNGRIKKRDM